MGIDQCTSSQEWQRCDNLLRRFSPGYHPRKQAENALKNTVESLKRTLDGTVDALSTPWKCVILTLPATRNALPSLPAR
jgi:hypothetical protein